MRENTVQYKSVELNEYPLEPGRYLIEASAGTGKTFTIANLVRRLVTEKNIPMSRLLVTTFTNAAAAELKDRIVKELEATLKTSTDVNSRLRLKMAISSIDEAVITTIHGFCFRMLYGFSLECGLDPDMTIVKDYSDCKTKLMNDYLRQKEMLKPEGVEEMLSPITPYITEINPGKKQEFRELLETVRDKLHGEMCLNHQMSYDDVIHFFDRVVADKEAAALVRSRFSAVFVDEFQDTSSDQCSVLNRCFPSDDPSVLFYMIGDPKQSIYRFRGADIYAYLSMKKGGLNDIFSMPANYRSSEFAIEAVNQIFAGDGEISGNAFLQSGIDFVRVRCGKPGCFRMYEKNEEVTCGMRIRDYRQKKDEADALIYEDVTREIVSLLSEERNVTIKVNGEEAPLRASDIAILVQRHDQAAEFVRRLAEYGISASACKSGRIFDSPEALCMKYLFQAWFGNSAEAVRQLMLSKFFGWSCERVADNPGGDWFDALKRQAELFEEHGLPAAFTAFLDCDFAGAETTPREQILCSVNGERSMSNLQQLVELLHMQAKKENLSPVELAEYLFERINSSEDDADVEIGSDDNPEQLRLDRDTAAVQIVTMFAAKGLEYPIVFVPFPVKTGGRYMAKMPYRLRGENGMILSYSDADKPAEIAEALREQVRLLYVALTRGKVMTYVCTRTAEPPNGNAINFLQSAHGVMVSAPDRCKVISGQKKIQNPADWFWALFEENRETCGVFERFEPGEVGTLRQEEEKKVSELEAAEFPEINNSWHMMSFSSYGYGSHSGGTGAADRGDTGNEPETDKVSETERFLSFPRGASVGELVHGVFEKLARRSWQGCGFSVFLPENGEKLAFVEDQLKELLDRSRMDSSIQLPRLLDGLKRALCTPLPGVGVPLCRVENCMAETEFFLKGETLALPAIISILRQKGSDSVRDFLPSASGMPDLTGLLNGIIDLVFEYEGKYYNLRDAMMRSGYVLQYHLYTAALCMRMKQGMNGFDYEAFGGVYYLFPRGMGKGEDGIWFDRPPMECINGLVKLFSGEEL